MGVKSLNPLRWLRNRRAAKKALEEAQRKEEMAKFAKELDHRAKEIRSIVSAAERTSVRSSKPNLSVVPKSVQPKIRRDDLRNEDVVHYSAYGFPDTQIQSIDRTKRDVATPVVDVVGFGGQSDGGGASGDWEESKKSCSSYGFSSSSSSDSCSSSDSSSSSND